MDSFESPVVTANDEEKEIPLAPRLLDLLISNPRKHVARRVIIDEWPLRAPTIIAAASMPPSGLHCRIRD